MVTAAMRAYTPEMLSAEARRLEDYTARIVATSHGRADIGRWALECDRTASELRALADGGVTVRLRPPPRMRRRGLP
jgi:hypothetical protein